MHSSTDAGALRRDQGGSALIMALFVTIFTLGIVITGSTLLKENQTRVETQFLLHGQAVNFARSGLTEALNWFRRQTTQPVAVFAPIDDPGAIPPVLDTEDEEIGLVREFKITGNIWGRYEVWKEWNTDPDPIRLAWRQKMQVRDISALRDVSGTGAAWGLKCIGYIYRQFDNTVAYNEKPNQILASEILSVEITRLSFALPGQAALCTDTGGTALLRTGFDNFCHGI